MKYIINLILTALLVVALSYMLPGVSTSSFLSAIIVSLVISLLNLLVRPILVLFTIPITIITFGLFLLVVNTLIILMADWLVGPAFETDGFWWAFIFAILLALGRYLLARITGEDD